MSIINRYIAKEFIIYFLSCLLSLIFIAIVFAALAELKLLEEENGRQLFLDAILSGIPLLIEIITPISVLLATVLTFISLSRSSEVIAMMAAGVSLAKMVLPILATGVIIGICTYLNQSYLAPLWGADKRTSMVDSRPTNNSWQFFQGKLYYFSGLSSRTKTVQNSRIFEFDSRHRIKKISNFRKLKVEKRNWKAVDGKEVVIADNRLAIQNADTTNFYKSSFPVVFKKELKHPKYSGMWAILTEIRLKRQGSVNFEADLFALYQKMASILSIFVMILLALPFSLYSARKSNVRMGIVVSVIMGFTFWLIDQIFVSFSSAGLMPAEAAAFGANTLFALLALVLIRWRRV